MPCRATIRSRQSVRLATAVLLVAAVAGSAPAQEAPLGRVQDFDPFGGGVTIERVPDELPSFSIDWWLAPRYGAPADGDPRAVRMRNSRQYVVNDADPDAVATFDVAVDIGWTGAVDVTGVEITVEAAQPGLLAQPIRIAPSLQALRASAVLERPEATVSLPEGRYTVTARFDVFPPHPLAVATAVIEVEDIFIAVIGDSYTAGEGAPAGRDALGNQTYVARWASGRTTGRYPLGPHSGDLPDRPPHDFRDGEDWEDFRFRLPNLTALRARDYAGYQNYLAHRSPLSTTSLAAIAIEEADPKTSVTYVSFAETGARIGQNATHRRTAGIARIACRSGSSGTSADDGGRRPNVFGQDAPAQRSGGCGFVLSGEAGERGFPPLEPLGATLPFVELNGETVPNLGLPQVTQVMSVARGRTIDVLVIGIGGNDTGFADLAQALGERGGPGIAVDCDDVSFAQLRSVIQSGQFSELPCADEDRVGLGRLHTAFAELFAFIEAERRRNDVEIGTVVLLGVPTPTLDGFNAGGGQNYAEFFTWIAGRQGQQGLKQFIGADLKVDPEESAFVTRSYICPLNQRLARIADQNGATFVHFGRELFRHNGMSSGLPGAYGRHSPFEYRPRVYPINVLLGSGSAYRAFRPYFASMLIQGSFSGAAEDNRGVLHPNEYGYRAMAHVLLRRLAQTVPAIGAMTLPDASAVVAALPTRPEACDAAVAGIGDSPGQTPPGTNELGIPRQGLALAFTPVVVAGPPQAANRGGAQFREIAISVTNWASLPDGLFAPAPDLPPCGANASASRTWVDLFDADTGRRLYGYCALGSASALGGPLYLTVTDGADVPRRIRVDIRDRATGTTYSGTAEVPR